MGGEITVDANTLVTSTEVDEMNLLRRIASRALHILFAIYVAAFLDRANIPNALTMVLQKDMGLAIKPTSSYASFHPIRAV
ncbi:hypothetical protein CC80DRAFT_541787 [Byssothecium circinans]|uniref:Major facilitator superfamily (MFS) profile domain-containing protein n=1 Tax=Byssothecium circinans TaxID=147558 RepID=A0A6A5UBT8_9PLEO|nr:hypothetical protein CC80DRAFT_541787 [Byssothecium circinans]